MTGQIGDEDEELAEPPPRPAVRRVVGVLAALAITGALVLALTQHHWPQRADRTPNLGTPAPSTPVAGPPASDALLPGSQFGFDTDSATLSYYTLVLNNSDTAVSVIYPITMIGPAGVMPAEAAGLYDPNVDITAPAGKLAAVQRVLPKQTAMLLVRVRVDCRQAAAQQRWPAAFPVIQVRLAGYSGTADFTLEAVMGGYASLLRASCGK